jgi:hypothetical protein
MAGFQLNSWAAVTPYWVSMFKQEHSASSITTHLSQVEIVPVAVGAGAPPETDVPTRTLLVADDFTAEEEAEVVTCALEVVDAVALPLTAMPRTEELTWEPEVVEALPALTLEVIVDLRLVVALP